MKNTAVALLLLFFLFLLPSCGLLFDSEDTTIVYVVNPKTLNVREEPDEKGKLLGKVEQGDTIFAIDTYKQWIAFEFNSDTAFIHSKFLRAVAIPTEELEKKFTVPLSEKDAAIVSALNKYTDWQSWEFWIVSAILTILSIGGTILGIQVDKKIKRFSRYFKGENMFPYITALIGFFAGFVYTFWNSEVQNAIFIEPFWWLPFGKGGIAWYLWIVTSALIGTLIVSVIYDIKKIGKYFALRSAFFLPLSALTFITVALVTMAVIYLAIGLTIVFVGYWILQGLAAPSPSGSHKKASNSAYAEYCDKQRADLAAEQEREKEERRFWESYHRTNDPD